MEADFFSYTKTNYQRITLPHKVVDTIPVSAKLGVRIGLRRSKMANYYKLDEAARIPYLIKLAEAKGFPIIQIREEAEPRYHSDDESHYIPDYSGNYVFDTKKMAERAKDDTLYDVFEINYVGDLIERALTGWADGSSSRKYSFGDTPSWWNEFAPDTTEGRELINFDVSVNY
jgi:hypothetical protein